MDAAENGNTDKKKSKNLQNDIVWGIRKRVTDNEDQRKSPNLNIIGVSRHFNSEEKKILKWHVFLKRNL